MMLHRHFEKESQKKNMTTLADVTAKEEFVSDVFPPDEKAVEAPKRRGGRPKKTAE